MPVHSGQSVCGVWIALAVFLLSTPASAEDPSGTYIINSGGEITMPEPPLLPPFPGVAIPIPGERDGPQFTLPEMQPPSGMFPGPIRRFEPVAPRPEIFLAPNFQQVEPTAQLPDAQKSFPTVASTSTVVTVPTIDAVGSNVDAATLKAFLSGNVAENAAAIANLTATRIDIPEVDLDITRTMSDGTTRENTTQYHNVRIGRVDAGVAEAVSVGGLDLKGEPGITVKLGKISYDRIDIGAALALYGLLKGNPEAPRKPIFSNLVAEGGTLSIRGGGNCVIHRMSVAGATGRPVTAGSIAAVYDMRPEEMPKFLAFYGDFVDAMETSSGKFGGFACTGIGPDGKPAVISMGDVTFGPSGGGRFPDVVIRDIDINAGSKGEIRLGTVHVKGFSVSGLGAALGHITDAAWLHDNYRSLIPAFAGLSVADVKLDGPAPNGTKARTTIADFDVDLDDYVNGIPTEISSRLSHLIMALAPAAAKNPAVQSLIDFGIRDLDLDYEVAAKWDEATDEIVVKRFSVDGARLGAVKGSGVIGRATGDLFSSDVATARAAVNNLTIKQVNLQVSDAGLGNLVAREQAASSGKSVAALRRSASGIVRGTLLVLLGGTAEASRASAAAAEFINGRSSLSVDAVAKDPSGVGLEDIPAIMVNPASAGDKVTIRATAN